MKHGSDKMPGYLNVYTELEKPVGVKENTDDENTKRIEQVQRIPKYIGVMCI